MPEPCSGLSSPRLTGAAAFFVGPSPRRAGGRRSLLGPARRPASRPSTALGSGSSIAFRPCGCGPPPGRARAAARAGRRAGRPGRLRAHRARSAGSRGGDRRAPRCGCASRRPPRCGRGGRRRIRTGGPPQHQGGHEYCHSKRRANGSVDRAYREPAWPTPRRRLVGVVLAGPVAAGGVGAAIVAFALRVCSGVAGPAQ